MSLNFTFKGNLLHILVLLFIISYTSIWATEPIDGKEDPTPNCECEMVYDSELICNRCAPVRYKLDGTPICGLDRDAKCADGSKLSDCSGEANYYCVSNPYDCCEPGLVIQVTNPFCGLSTPSNTC